MKNSRSKIRCTPYTIRLAAFFGQALTIVIQSIIFLGIGLYAENGIANDFTVATKKCVVKYGSNSYMTGDGKCFPLKASSNSSNLYSPGFVGKPTQKIGQNNAKPTKNQLEFQKIMQKETKASNGLDAEGLERNSILGKIIGLDNRKPSFNSNGTLTATANPEAVRQTVLIAYKLGSGADTTIHHCTGWLYGTNVVATAAHCLFDRASSLNDYKSTGRVNIASIQVTPGYNIYKTTRNPYGTCGVKGGNAAYAAYPPAYATTPNEFWNDSNPHDYGAIKLNCTVGSQTGWFSIWSPATTVSLLNQKTTIYGYPGDKPLSQWYSEGTIVENNVDTNGSQIGYSNDTMARDSGAPVFQKRALLSAGCVGNCVMGIVSYETYDPGKPYNIARRIDSTVFNFLTDFKNRI